MRRQQINIYFTVFYFVPGIIIMHQEMSLIEKKLINMQNLPYFYQNSLKIFLNLTQDCWKKIWQLCKG